MFLRIAGLAAIGGGALIPNINTEAAILDNLKDEGSKSHIGMIIHSTTLDTEDKVKAEYGGETWIQHTDYFLRGASSGVVANQTTKTGGEDAVTLTAAQSGVPAHAHASVASGFILNQPSVGPYPIGLGVGNTTLYNSTYHNATANNTPQNASQAHNNVPNYKSVYIWERTA